MFICKTVYILFTISHPSGDEGRKIHRIRQNARITSERVEHTSGQDERPNNTLQNIHVSNSTHRMCTCAGLRCEAGSCA